jgi:hypothetical protein
MQLHELTRSKIEKFFHSEKSQSVMEFAGKEYENSLDKIHEKFMDQFRDWLCDEYSLFYEECIKDGIEREIRSLLLGDEKVLEKYSLAPSDWGLRCDHYKIRRKIVEENKDIIKNTYIQSLEEQVARLEDLVDMYKNKYEWR